ncbi:class I SAM-dependent methyltransferase [Agrococcus casei]|uniref:class I SAM-dependent methyltransferase n=1 Tax=Agrococcus casei TaxID=343512 RepID=UPI003F920D2A
MDDLEPRHVDIDWSDARAANQLNWNDRASLHEEAYGIERYANDRELISGVVREDAPVLSQHLNAGLSGLDLLHLQCHIGTDTISLARLGARVTGLDFSPASLEVAKRLAIETDITADWVEADVLDARQAVSGDFDVVYTSIGTIIWLPDLDRWAKQIAALLRTNGVFFIRDGHPMMYALDEEAPDLTLRWGYFPTGQAQTWDDETTYAGDGKVEHTRTYEWPHLISEIITALLRAGLVIERLDEGQTLPWRFSPRMVELEDGDFAWPDSERSIVPCTFTIVARKP